MNKKIIVVMLLLSLVMSGCATKQRRRPIDNKSYNLGVEQKVRVGETILFREKGDEIQYEVWQGMLMGGWVKKDWSLMEGSKREELLYSGKLDNKLKIDYREYRVAERTVVPFGANAAYFRPFTNFYAVPAFYQSLEYDLNLSEAIVFRDFSLSIQDANNEYLSFIVLKDK